MKITGEKRRQEVRDRESDLEKNRNRETDRRGKERGIFPFF